MRYGYRMAAAVMLLQVLIFDFNFYFEKKLKILHIIPYNIIYYLFVTLYSALRYGCKLSEILIEKRAYGVNLWG